MKYMKDQDTGEIFYPRIHAGSICDLDVDEASNILVEHDIVLSNSVHFAAGASISYREYVKMIYISINADLKPAAITKLQEDGFFSEDLPEDFPICKVKLNLICKNSNGLSSYCTAYGNIDNKVITINAITLEPTYSMVDDVLTEVKVPHSFEAISGCGYAC